MDTRPCLQPGPSSCLTCAVPQTQALTPAGHRAWAPLVSPSAPDLGLRFPHLLCMVVTLTLARPFCVGLHLQATAEPRPLGPPRPQSLLENGLPHPGQLDAQHTVGLGALAPRQGQQCESRARAGGSWASLRRPLRVRGQRAHGLKHPGLRRARGAERAVWSRGPG